MNAAGFAKANCPNPPEQTYVTVGMTGLEVGAVADLQVTRLLIHRASILEAARADIAA